jgi:hypothetical protein
MNRSDEDLCLLLSLLEKAEKILSLINLSDTAISKYNQLKQMTFEKLNISFTPLIKRASMIQMDNQMSNQDNLLQVLYYQSMKKTMLIDLLMDFISKLPDSNINSYITSLNNIFNIPFQNKSIDEIDCETKIQEQKICDLFSKCDELIKKTSSYLNQITCDYENKIENMKNCYENELQKLKCELDRLCYVENDLVNLRKQNDATNLALDKISCWINESYDKFYQGDNSPRIEMNNCSNQDKVVNRLQYLLGILDKFYTDNKYLSEIVPNLQKEKLDLVEQQNLPFVNNVINNNGVMNNLAKNVGDIQKQSDTFHKNFQDLMNYISNNIEGKLV